MCTCFAPCPHPITAVDQGWTGLDIGTKADPVATQETGAGRAKRTEKARISTNSQKDET
jgi:hypothetical protein